MLILTAVLATACGRTESDEPTSAASQRAGSVQPAPRTITVGFSQIGAESAWRTAETQSIRSEGAKRGMGPRFSDAQQKQENQIKALRTFIEQGVDAIILAPVVETGWEPVLRDIKAAGIPVILVDRGVDVSDDSLYATLIASDFVEEGRMAANWLVGKMAGNANIVELKEPPARPPPSTAKRAFTKSSIRSRGCR